MSILETRFKAVLFLLTGFFLSTNLAGAGIDNNRQGKAILRIGHDQASRLQLDVIQMPLAKVLQELSSKTGTPIHYSVLPEGLITATCVGGSLQAVLECLLNRKADIIVRYARDSAGHRRNANIAEAWVLGSKLEAAPSSALCKTGPEQGLLPLNRNGQHSGAAALSKPDQTDLLLKNAASKKPEERAQAISDLLSIGRQNDPKVQELLERAVHDQDANVRAQAVSTLTHRGDYNENAAQIIQEAMQDESVDVRLMAVDGINGDARLLEQAINDPDETVSSFAASKLEELRKLEAAGN